MWSLKPSEFSTYTVQRVPTSTARRGCESRYTLSTGPLRRKGVSPSRGRTNHREGART